MRICSPSGLAGPPGPRILRTSSPLRRTSARGDGLEKFLVDWQNVILELKEAPLCVFRYSPRARASRRPRTTDGAARYWLKKRARAQVRTRRFQRNRAGLREQTSSQVVTSRNASPRGVRASRRRRGPRNRGERCPRDRPAKEKGATRRHRLRAASAVLHADARPRCLSLARSALLSPSKDAAPTRSAGATAKRGALSSTLASAPKATFARLRALRQVP